MDRAHFTFSIALVSLVLLTRAVFSQVPTPVDTPQPSPVATTTEVTMTETPDGPSTPGPDGLPSSVTITDEVASDSTNPWDRVRDIFQPPVRPGVAVPRAAPVVVAETPEEIKQPEVRRPVLQGVLISSDDDRIAILDDQFTRPGDFCAGFEVKTINKNTVVLTREGKEFVLYVKQ